MRFLPVALSFAFVLLPLSLTFAQEAPVVSFEAESFVEQTQSEIRSWQIFRKGAETQPSATSDGDPPHFEGIDKKGAYLEILPDTRRNHSEKLIHGENFSPQPGKMAILKYRVKFPKAGKYYVWARAFSTGTEDNGFHVGLNGEWPESGQRWQTIVKKRWHWECKQRTAKVHIGVPMQLYLDIPKAGENEILISMREDGCELDKFVLAMDRNYRPPEYFRENKSKATAAKLPPIKINRKPNGDGKVTVSGDLKTWHKLNLTVNGPWAHERDPEVNPFTDYRLDVAFQHESGQPNYTIPGYFAADGNASETSAESGTQWRAHLSPDKAGKWNYQVKFTWTGKLSDDAGQPLPIPGDQASGSFTIADSDKSSPDLRARGRLQYTGERYLKFAGDKTYFLKAGPDAPETFLAYTEFDGTRTKNAAKGPLKQWQKHLQDWQSGDPTWQKGKGKGIIGAVNYLSGKGVNAFSFLTYNAGGDGDNIWPFIDRNETFRYDVSKLDHWGKVFDHATAKGMYLHFKLQETENDDQRLKGKNAKVPTALDGGKLGPERKLYLRELIARYGHNLALNWNIGEENTQTPDEVRDIARYIKETDPYDHHIVIHTYPNQQDAIYPNLLGDKSELTGASLQNPWDVVHLRTLKWIRESRKAGKQWVVANDEQNPADLGVPPDPGYAGHSGWAEKNNKRYNLDDIRRDTLWGNLMAGGAGVEYYFGYKLPENDLRLEDFRSRDKSWDYCRIAIDIFHRSGIPFWEMESADQLVSNPKSESNKAWCLAKAGECYIIYIPEGVKAVEFLPLKALGKQIVKATAYDPKGNKQPKSIDLSSALLGEGKETAIVIKIEESN